LLPTLLLTSTTAELLGDLVTELAGPPAAFDLDLVGLHLRHRGDLRAALRELYDRCAERPPGERGATRLSAG
jgi:hypothetical protein